MIRLSWDLKNTTPAYGNGKSLQITPVKCLDHGDSCNTLELSLSNHLGTHIDFPYHFDLDGKNINDYANDFFYFNHVLVIELNLEEGQLIQAQDIERVPANDQSEIILFHSKWSLKRDQEIYMLNPPGVHKNCADMIRSRFPNVRMIGFDFISLSSFSNRTMGREAHRAFLKDQHPICIVEDMDLRELPKIENLLISPLMLHEADGAPVTIWANLP